MAQAENVEEHGIVTLQSDIKAIKSGVDEFNKVKKELIGTVHVMTIKNHPYIKKSGWRIVALGFNISDRIVSKEYRDLPNGHYVVTYTVEARAPNGRTVQAIGSCSTLEKEWLDKEKSKVNLRMHHDAETQAHTRSKNRAIADLVGLGEVTAEEMTSNGNDQEEEPQVKFCSCEGGPKTQLNGKCKDCGNFSEIWYKQTHASDAR